jgi:hypothetical protein
MFNDADEAEIEGLGTRPYVAHARMLWFLYSSVLRKCAHRYVVLTDGFANCWI